MVLPHRSFEEAHMTTGSFVRQTTMGLLVVLVVVIAGGCKVRSH
jgi:hypothetical protein